MEESQIERWEVLQSASTGLRCEMHLQLPNWPGSINRAKVLEAAGLCRVDTLLGDRRVPKGAVKDPWIFSDPASSSPVFEDNHVQCLSLAETQIFILREQLTISLAAGGKIDPAGNNGDHSNNKKNKCYFHIFSYFALQKSKYLKGYTSCILTSAL